ncbi:hypothetical protein Syun_022469 [Stephania yunnanensis]|uniref:Uncharacterized protein n=1 Tax=Stephania yunnanensis TaxID=152371 RepID=A0AAP0FD19_9MAGN
MQFELNQDFFAGPKFKTRRWYRKVLAQQHPHQELALVGAGITSHPCLPRKESTVNRYVKLSLAHENGIPRNRKDLGVGCRVSSLVIETQARHFEVRVFRDDRVDLRKVALHFYMSIIKKILDDSVLVSNVRATM